MLKIFSNPESWVKKLKECEYWLTDDLHPETEIIHNKLLPIMKRGERKDTWHSFY